MDDDQKKETYEVARQAVHDELRALIIDISGTLFGFLFLYVGIMTFINSPPSQPFISIVGIAIGVFGLLMIGIVWKWDRWIYNHLPIGS